MQKRQHKRKVQIYTHCRQYTKSLQFKKRMKWKFPLLFWCKTRSLQIANNTKRQKFKQKTITKAKSKGGYTGIYELSNNGWLNNEKNNKWTDMRTDTSSWKCCHQRMKTLMSRDETIGDLILVHRRMYAKRQFTMPAKQDESMQCLWCFVVSFSSFRCQLIRFLFFDVIVGISVGNFLFVCLFGEELP